MKIKFQILCLIICFDSRLQSTRTKQKKLIDEIIYYQSCVIKFRVFEIFAPEQKYNLKGQYGKKKISLHNFIRMTSKIS